MSVSGEIAAVAMATDADSHAQDERYRKAAAEFGPVLARLAAGCESDHARRDDLLQEMHLALWRSLAAFRNQCSLRTWVYRVAQNTAASHVRQQKRGRRLLRQVTLDELEAVPHPFDNERATDEAAILQRIIAIAEHLSTMDRNILLLYLEGLNAAEIADVVGISPNNAAQKIHRIKRVLKQRLQAGDP